MTILKQMLTPFQKFEKTEGLSGFLLVGATILALIWANSPFSAAYQNLWQYEIGINTSNFSLNKPLILWINDGLMAIFFFLIGLEIKRELIIGELNTLRKATLPIFGAIGGMLFPVLVFLLLNNNDETMHGWGIPMATDIAFTLAIIRLFGDRIPTGLKVFMTAFAIIDDIGAVLVIALFYTGGISAKLVLFALFLLGVLFVLSYFKVYAKYLILLFGIVIWYLFLKAGIHPTVAGVILAFTIPIRQRMDFTSFTENCRSLISKFNASSTAGQTGLSDKQIEYLDELETMTDKVQSPVQHLEHKLHNWVAYFIIPVFALANAGIAINRNIAVDSSLIIAIAVALVLGKTLGITLMSYISVKLKIADLPEYVTPMQILGVSLLAGVGFTMSLFISNLAYPNGDVVANSAKIGILLGSLVSGLGGYLILRWSLAKERVKAE